MLFSISGLFRLGCVVNLPLIFSQVETNNRFWSVGSTLVVCRKFINDKLSKSEDVNRIAFYNKLKCMANCEKVTTSCELSRQVSRIGIFFVIVNVFESVFVL